MFGINFLYELYEFRVKFFGLRSGGLGLSCNLEDALEGLLIFGSFLYFLVSITMNDQFIKAYIFRLRRCRSVLYLKSRLGGNLTLMNIKATKHIIETSCEGFSFSGGCSLAPCSTQANHR